MIRLGMVVIGMLFFTLLGIGIEQSIAQPEPRPTPSGEEIPLGFTLSELEAITSENGQEIVELQSLAAEGVTVIAWSPQGGKFILRGRMNAQLLSIQDNTALMQYLSNNRFSVANFNRDGQLFALGNIEGTVSIWDLALTQEILFDKDDSSIQILELSFDAVGDTLLSIGLNGTLNAWDLEERSLIRGFDIPNFSQGAFNHEGTLFASLEQNISTPNTLSPIEIDIWDTHTGSKINTLTPETYYAPSRDVLTFALSYNHDSSLLVIGRGDDEDIRIWDLVLLEQVTSLPIQVIGGGLEQPIIFSPDDRLLAIGDVDGQIHLWDVETLLTGDVDDALMNSFDAHDGVIYTVSFNPAGTLLVSTGQDDTLKLWGIPQGD